MTQLAAAWIDRFARKFSNQARRQGYDYVQFDRVKIHEGNERFVDAAVTGNEIYRVTLSLEDLEVLLS